MMSFQKPISAILKTFIKKPMTLVFPKEKLPFLEGYRGRQILDMEKCIGCSRCAKACPNLAIEMVERPSKTEDTNSNEKSKKKIPKYPQINLGKCCFCGLCAENCPKDALTMSVEQMICVLEKDDVVYTPEMLSQPPGEFLGRFSK
jgi:NADH-quinone oxidoreductase subunit I